MSAADPRPLISRFATPREAEKRVGLFCSLSRPAVLRHCEERSDVAIRSPPGRESPLMMHLSGLAAEKCEPPLPVADEGGTESLQPRRWLAVAKQARDRHLRQSGIAGPPWMSPRRCGERRKRIAATVCALSRNDAEKTGGTDPSYAFPRSPPGIYVCVRINRPSDIPLQGCGRHGRISLSQRDLCDRRNMNFNFSADALCGIPLSRDVHAFREAYGGRRFPGFR